MVWSQCYNHTKNEVFHQGLQFFADLFIFAEEILNGKLHFCVLTDIHILQIIFLNHLFNIIFSEKYQNSKLFD